MDLPTAEDNRRNAVRAAGGHPGPAAFRLTVRRRPHQGPAGAAGDAAGLHIAHAKTTLERAAG